MYIYDYILCIDQSIYNYIYTYICTYMIYIYSMIIIYIYICFLFNPSLYRFGTPVVRCPHPSPMFTALRRLVRTASMISPDEVAWHF